VAAATFIRVEEIPLETALDMLGKGVGGVVARFDPEF